MTINATAGTAYDGWAFDLRPMWSMARHRCGHVEYLMSPTGEDIARYVEGHLCAPGADIDPVLGQGVHVEIDLGPVSEITFGSFALLVESLPFGLMDRHPRLRAQAERIREGLDSHLDTPEPPPAPGELAVARAALHARHIAGTLGDDEPVYVSVFELEGAGGRLPRRIDATDDPQGIGTPRDALGVMWVGPDDSGPETCARHLIDEILRGDIQRTLDPAALGLVLYDAVDCSTCATQHIDDARQKLDEVGARYELAEDDQVPAHVAELQELYDQRQAVEGPA